MKGTSKIYKMAEAISVRKLRKGQEFLTNINRELVISGYQPPSQKPKHFYQEENENE